MTGSGSASPTRGALIISGMYLIAAGLYIAVSSTWLGTIAASPDVQAWIEVAKGFAFVLVTSVLLFVAMRRRLVRLQQVERELADRARALTRAEMRASVAVVAGSVAHEMKNMITVLQGAHALLDKDARRTGPEADELLQDMGVAIERLGTLSRDLLARSRTRDPKPELVVADRALPEIAKLLRALDRERRLTFQVHAEPDCVFLVDRLDLEYAMVNLTLNAAEAGAHRLELRAERQDGAVRVIVADDGPGVERSLRDRVFEPFVTSKEGGGTGLGLAIVRDALERNGASIRLQEGGAGAVFVLQFRAR